MGSAFNASRLTIRESIIQTANEYFVEDVYLYNLKKNSEIIVEYKTFIAETDFIHDQFANDSSLDNESQTDSAIEADSDTQSENEDSSEPLLQAPNELEQKLIELNNYWIGEEDIDRVIESEILPFESVDSV